MLHGGSLVSLCVTMTFVTSVLSQTSTCPAANEINSADNPDDFTFTTRKRCPAECHVSMLMIRGIVLLIVR